MNPDLIRRSKAQAGLRGIQRLAVAAQNQNRAMVLESANAEALFAEGNHHLAAGDASAAEARFREAMRIAPDFAEAHDGRTRTVSLPPRMGTSPRGSSAYKHAINYYFAGHGTTSASAIH